MSRLILPRGYLSWTQVSLWKANPDKYVAHYIYGEASHTNDGMDFGSRAAKALETGEVDDDEMINTLVTLLSKYEVMEHEIEVDFKTPHGSFTLLGKLDTFDPKTLMFREYKTGRTPWTLGKARKHGQILQYCAMIYLKYGKLPPMAHLDWAQTAYGPEGVYLTGEIKTFLVTKTLREVLMYLSEVSVIAYQIHKRYAEELKKII